MRPRAERRLGIEPENDVFRLRFIRLPGRLDHDALPHALRMEIRLPIILPVRVGDMAHKRRARRRVEAIGAREPHDPLAKLRKARREILVLRQIRLHDDRLLRLRRHGLPALRLREILPLLLRILVDDAPRAHIEQRLRDKLHLLMRRPQTDFRPIQKNPSFPHGIQAILHPSRGFPHRFVFLSYHRAPRRAKFSWPPRAFSVYYFNSD